MSVTIESKPTTNYADFDPIFPDLSPLCLGTWSVVQRLSRKDLNGLECYSELARDHTCALKAAKSFDAVDWRQLCNLREVKLSLLCSSWKNRFFVSGTGNHRQPLFAFNPCQLFSAPVKVARGARKAVIARTYYNYNFVSDEENGPGPGK